LKFYKDGDDMMNENTTIVKKNLRKRKVSQKEESKYFKNEDISDSKIGDLEYTLNLKKYLEKAIIENEKVSKDNSIFTILTLNIWRIFKIISNCLKIFKKQIFISN
jgi:hypothetical protein